MLHTNTHKQRLSIRGNSNSFLNLKIKDDLVFMHLLLEKLGEIKVGGSEFNTDFFLSELS